METVTDFILLGSKITVDGESSHEIKRHLLLGRKAMTNLVSILKSRDITLPTKVHLVKAMVFSVVMYGCESWTIKKAEHQRIDALELWCWRRLFRIPWTARRPNQSVLKEINPEFIGRTDAEAEAPILWSPDVKSQLIGENPEFRKQWWTYWKRLWCWERLRAGGERGWLRMRWLDGITHSMDNEFEQTLRDSEGQGSLVYCSSCGFKKSDIT